MTDETVTVEVEKEHLETFQGWYDHTLFLFEDEERDDVIQSLYHVEGAVNRALDEDGDTV